MSISKGVLCACPVDDTAFSSKAVRDALDAAKCGECSSSLSSAAATSACPPFVPSASDRPLLLLPSVNKPFIHHHTDCRRYQAQGGHPPFLNSRAPPAVLQQHPLKPFCDTGLLLPDVVPAPFTTAGLYVLTRTLIDQAVRPPTYLHFVLQNQFVLCCAVPLCCCWWMGQHQSMQHLTNTYTNKKFGCSGLGVFLVDFSLSPNPAFCENCSQNTNTNVTKPNNHFTSHHNQIKFLRLSTQHGRRSKSASATA